jgi:hypothetical protein
MKFDQKNIPQLQNWSFSDEVDGCALDNRYTSKHHQIFNVEMLPNGLYRLNYVIAVPEKKLELKNAIPSNFIDLVYSNHAPKNKEARHKFNQISEALVDTKKDKMFVRNDYKQGLRVSFDIDSAKEGSYSVVGSDITNCMARINSVVTYDEANNKINERSYRDQLIFLNKFVTQNKAHNKPKSGLLPFEDAVNLITKMVQEKAKDYALENGIECVFRRKVPSNNRQDKYSYINSGRAQQPKASSYHWTVPITSSRMIVPALNSVVFHHYNENKENMLTPEMAEALSIMAPYAKELKNPKRSLV